MPTTRRLCSFSLFLTVIINFPTEITTQAVSEDELNRIIASMYLNDPDRARPTDIVLNYQSHSNSHSRTDSSKEKLFKYVSPALINSPVYAKFSALLDNYFARTGEKEMQNATETREIEDFLAYVYETPVFKRTFDYLQSKKHPSAATLVRFRIFFRDLWFDFYSRKGGAADTSGFEHVFVGELLSGTGRDPKPPEVGGLHNWFRFYQLEKSGAADYAGFVVKRRNLIAMIQYQWSGVWKTGGSFIVGTSPQFDMCAFTLCFLLRPGFKTCRFDLDGCQVSVTSHTSFQNGRPYVGTVFPSPGLTSPSCR